MNQVINMLDWINKNFEDIKSDELLVHAYNISKSPVNPTPIVPVSYQDEVKIAKN